MSESELTIRSLGARAVAAPLARPLRLISRRYERGPMILTSNGCSGLAAPRAVASSGRTASSVCW